MLSLLAREMLKTKIEGFTLDLDDFLNKPLLLNGVISYHTSYHEQKNFQGRNVLSFTEIEIDIFSRKLE